MKWVTCGACPVEVSLFTVANTGKQVAVGAQRGVIDGHRAADGVHLAHAGQVEHPHLPVVVAHIQPQLPCMSRNACMKTMLPCRKSSAPCLVAHTRGHGQHRSAGAPAIRVCKLSMKEALNIRECRMAC